MAGDGRRGRRSFDLRTWLAGIDPGLTRLRLAAIAVTSMIVAVAVVAVLRALLDPSEPVTVLLFTGVLAMISNLAVNEPTLPRRRTTTALLILPAAASTVAGAFVAPYPIASAVSFVVVMVVAVWVRRYGPRGFALGMAAFMPFFFTQFLKVAPAQVPWLLVAVVVGVSSTLLLRGVVFAERPARTLRRMVTAFRARAHALVGEIDDVLVELPREGPDEGDLESVRRARARLQEVALLVEDALEQTTAGRVWPGLDDDTLALRVADAELALERLSVVVRRLALPPADGPPEPLDPVVVAALRTGVGHLRTALGAGTDQATILEAAADARAAVAGLVADTRAGGERVQRTAFAIRRVADAIHHAQLDAPSPASAPGRRDAGTPRAGHAVAGRARRPARAGEHGRRARAPPRRGRRAARGGAAAPRGRDRRHDAPGRAGRGGGDARDRRQRVDRAAALVLGGDRRVRRVRRHQQPRRPAHPRAGAGSSARSAAWSPAWGSPRWSATTRCCRSCCCSSASSSPSTWCASRRRCSRSGSPRCSRWSTASSASSASRCSCCASRRPRSGRPRASSPPSSCCRGGRARPSGRRSASSSTRSTRCSPTPPTGWSAARRRPPGGRACGRWTTRW